MKINLVKPQIFKVVLFFIVLSLSAKTYSQNYTYSNSDLGYSLVLPKEPNYSDEYSDFTIYSYNDGNSGKVYSFFALDLRENKLEPKEQANNFITNIVKNLNGELLNKKEIKYRDGLKFETLVKINTKKQIRSQFTLQNKILYYLSVEDINENIDDKSIEAFFTSLKIAKPKALAEKEWITYTNEVGAFSLNIPVEPTEIPREVENPLEEDGEPYILHMYSSVDTKNDDNYLFRYNDQPIGYYLEDPISGFESVQNDFEGKSTLLSEPKIIYLDGYEGREFELLLQDKYHCICRIYYRGNRTYLLLKHKLVENKKVSSDDEFFTSFKLEPYQNTELVKFTPKNRPFSIQYFESTKPTTDSLDYDDVYVKNSNDFFATNTNTGGVYQFGFSDIQDYFKIKSKKEFYDTTIESLKAWNDTIIKQNQVLVNNKEASEFYIQNKRTKVISRHKLWLEDKSMFLITAYLSKEEMENELTETIFNSFQVTNDNEDFNYFSSKSEAILKDLKATDTIRFNRAFGALSYYEFDTSDLPNIYKAIKDTYRDSITTQRIKNSLAEELASINDSTTLDFIASIYKLETTSDDLKANLLTTIPYLTNENKLETYNELLFSSPPLDDENYTWSLFSPFRDSLDFAIEHQKEILSLIKHEKYRSTILNLFNDMAGNDSTVVTKQNDALLAYALDDLKLFIDSNAEEEDYTYTSLTYAYLNLFKNQKLSKDIIDPYTLAIQNQEVNKWMQLNAIEARIYNNLPIEDKFLNEKLEDLYFRFEIMDGYHKTNAFNKIPKKYLKPEAFIELAMYNYISEDEESPDNVKVLGKFKKDNIEYYALSFSYLNEESSEKTEYLGIVESVKELAQDLPFERPKSFSNWDELEKDWKTQGINLIPDFIEYGY